MTKASAKYSGDDRESYSKNYGNERNNCCS